MTRRAAPRSVRVILASTLVTVAGCTTQQVSRPAAVPSAVPGLGPALSVERFLQAANERDWSTMMSLFGTEDGPVDWDRQYGERHMNLLAEILQHQDYALGAESAVPGRSAPTRQVLVDLVQTRRTVTGVPFVVVQSRDGAWLVEEIDTDRLTSR